MIIQNNFNNYSILDEHLVLRNDSIGNIPLLESSNENKYNVEYKYIENLMESYGYEIDEVIGELLRENNIDIEQLSISVLESDAIKNIEDVNFFNENRIDYEINPISNNDIISIYVDRLVESWINTGNDEYIALLESPELLLEETNEDHRYTYDTKNLNLSYKDKQGFFQTNNDYGSGVVATAYDKDGKQIGKKFNPADAGFLVKIKRFLTDKPRDVLAKIAARLRETYRKFLLKADKEKEEGKIKWYKNIARKVLQAIDWILRKIEGLKVNYMKRIEKGLDKKMNEDDNIKNIKIMHNKLKSHTVNRGELQDSNFMTEYIRNDRGEAIPTEHTMKKIYLDFAKRTNKEGRKLNDKAVKNYYDKHFNH